jgi:hypothetical protein
VVTTEQHLREVLRRATDPIEPALGEALARLQSARRKQQRRRVGTASALLATAFAFTTLLLHDKLGGDQAPEPPAGPAQMSVGTLRPGSYDLREGFDPPLELTVAAGWSSQVTSPGDVRLVPPQAPASLVGLADVARVFEPAGSGVRVRQAPTDLPSWIKGDPDLEGVRARGVRIGDLYGTRIVARVSGHPRLSSSCPQECTAMFDLDGGPLTAPAGSRLVFVLANDAGQFVTTYAISPPGEQHAAVAALAETLANLVIDGVGTAGDTPTG